MTAQSEIGHGIARRMCERSMERARQCGFRAKQFNFVESANERAVKPWSDVGCVTW
jgi:ribosomal protein S18 acetylase RimI-like enzyme